MRSFLTALLLAAFCASAWAQDAPATLRVIVEGAGPNEGQVILSLFDSEDTFLSAPTEEYTYAVDETGTVSHVFEALAPGTYAVSAIHDRNSNYRLDTNFLGIPREPVGVSNNPRPRFGPPRFEDAMFEITADDVELTITVGAATN